MTALRDETDIAGVPEVVDPVPGAGSPHLPEQPDLVQLLTPEGERREHPDHPLDVSDGELRGFYRDMTLVRRWDLEATALQRQGELGIWASLLGQEAAQLGAGRALEDGDTAFPTYREHGVAWARGVDPLHVMSLFRGVDNGGWDPVERGFSLYTIVIGAQCLHATGYAMGVQRDGAVGSGDPDRDTAVLACFGDGASAQGEVNEAFVWAGVFNAPVVFFCQNNQWAISEGNERQMRAPLYQRAAGFGFPGVRVDGNDVLAVEAVVAAAAERARAGEGPTLVEAFTYRMAAHTTSDDTTRYRSSAEEESWRARDPLSRLEAHLRATDAVDEQFFADLRAEGDAMAERVRREVRAMTDPEPLSMFDNVYAEPHALVDEERSWLAEWVATAPAEESR